MDYMIIDGHGLAYRAAHVLSLHRENGKNVSVIFGLLKMIHSLLEEHMPKSACIVWDCKGSMAKEKLFPGYKIHRRTLDWDKPDDREKVMLAREIRTQIDDLYNVIPAFGIKQLRVEGVEGDDIIGLLCDSLHGSILVVSSDKDIFQVVRPGISIYYPPKDKLLTVLNFEAEMGLKPELWLHFRCLTGDISDGIGGLKGFGEVTSKRILNEFGAWDTWWNGDMIRVAVLEKLNKAQKKVLLSKDSKELLDRNFLLMKLGFLVKDQQDQIVKDFEGQTPKFDVETIEKYFEENQLNSYLTKFTTWIHAFRLLERRGNS